RFSRDWSSDVCSSDLGRESVDELRVAALGEHVGGFPVDVPGDGRAIAREQEGPATADGELVFPVSREIGDEDAEDIAEALVPPGEAIAHAFPVARVGRMVAARAASAAGSAFTSGAPVAAGSAFPGIAA